MPIPNHLQTALSYTDSGVPYQTLMYPGYSESYASDAGALTIQVLVGSEHYADFLVDVLGIASFDGSAPPSPPVSPSATPMLQRTLPLQCPLNLDLWCDEAKLVKWGCIDNLAKQRNEDGEGARHDPDSDNWPKGDWVQVALRFTRPHYYVRSDEQLKSGYSRKEQFRFAEISRRYVPREQKQPSQYMEVNTKPDASGTWQPVEVASFIPVYDTEILIKLVDWPIDGFDDKRAATYTGCINKTTFATGDGYTYPVGTVKFQGMQQPISWYPDAAGEFVVSPVLCFLVRTGGWNFTLLPDRDVSGNLQYGPIRYRNVTPTTAPHPEKELQELFWPTKPT